MALIRVLILIPYRTASQDKPCSAITSHCEERGVADLKGHSAILGSHAYFHRSRLVASNKLTGVPVAI